MGVRSTRRKKRFVPSPLDGEGPMVLCIDTSSPWLNVALQKGDRLLARYSAVYRYAHARALLKVIDTIVDTHRLNLDRLDALGVCIGPGSFTGLRVGIAMAKSLAYSLKKPITGVSSTYLLALNTQCETLPVVCAVDAKKGEAYFAGYRLEKGQLVETVAPFAAKPEEGLASVQKKVGQDVLVVGSAVDAFQETFSQVEGVQLASADLNILDAKLLAQTCTRQARNGETTSSARLEPLYARGPIIG